MSTITTAGAGLSDRIPNQSSKSMNKVTKVYVRLMFLRIGEIDTLNEKYQAQASIEARWPVEFEKLSSELSPDDRKRLADGKSISLVNYALLHWYPQLYIENAIGDLKEQIRYSAKRSKIDKEVYVCEHRDIKGLFWEKLELQHFPSDVQDLSISIGSMYFNDKVVLAADPNYVSGVNREAFVDQQEWKLYEHVDTQQRFVKEFLFESADKDDDEDDGEGGDTKNSDERARSIITVTCHAARRSNYFYWNGYCLVLLITLASLCIFGIPPNLAANRIQISCTLLLTSITFRWTVNRSLPTISYLTSMDKYSIICIFNLVVQCFWHAIIGAIIFLDTPDNRLTPSMWYVKLDHYIFFVVTGIFIVLHLALMMWLHMVPLKHRKNMVKKDLEYQLSIFKKKKRQSDKTVEKKMEKSVPFSRIPISTDV